jgi:type II secretory pathway pseudopilin PulG
MAKRFLNYKRQMKQRQAAQIAGHVATRGNSYGFTYVGLLLLVTVIGIASTTTVKMGMVLQRRIAEDELLNIGNEFRMAFISYENATPAGQRRTPETLQDLLKDPRYPNRRRHLRKLYADPMTGKNEWGIVASPVGGGIVGVYSLSEGRPIKFGNFQPQFQDFAGKTSYRDWKFIGGAFSSSLSALPNQISR